MIVFFLIVINTDDTVRVSIIVGRRHDSKKLREERVNFTLQIINPALRKVTTGPEAGTDTEVIRVTLLTGLLLMSYGVCFLIGPKIINS